MTGFRQRFFRWWTQRRRIDDDLAARVASYIDETWEDPAARHEDVVAYAPSAAEYDEMATFGAGQLEAPIFAPAPAPAPSADHDTSLEELLENMDASFSETLLAMIDARGLKDAQVYRRANLSRQHFSKIRSDRWYRPTKNTVLALAIALELTLDECELLLERAGYSLSHASKSDIICEYFISRGEYDISTINRTLYHFDQKVLGN